MPSVSDYTAAAPPTVRPLLTRALADLGRREGDTAIPFATGAVPWCARWLSGILSECGVQVLVVWGALDLMRRLARWSVPHDGPLVAGDVVAWKRGEDGNGHVAIVLLADGDDLHVIAGNSGAHANRVAVEIVPRSTVAHDARPVTSW